MLEFVTIIMVTMTADGPVIGQHPRYFKSVNACEKQLFEFFQSSGGEIRTLSNKDIMYEVDALYIRLTDISRGIIDGHI